MSRENVISNYETVFIIAADTGDDNIKETADKFIGLIEANGTIIEKDEWGRKKLAYPIDFKEEGYYMLVKFSSAPAFIAELERVFNITDSILRSFTLKIK
ncbi:MAG: 30S ribosomal protein S6 [Oscillospiraceae bacterium]|nr:30S ribosomal protein S6 [Oscillospiraceae bacterium]